MSAPRARLGALVLVAAVAGLGADALYRARPRSAGGSERTDLPVYLAGSGRVLAGEDPLGATSGRGWPYWYPPTLAVLLVPLVPLPPLAAAGVWYGVSALALGGGLLALRAALDRRGSLDRWELLALAGLVFPATSALLRGQVGPLLLGLVGLALLDLRRGRPLRAGLVIALAAAIKLTPGVLLVGLLVARRWRAALSGLGGLVLWLVLLPAPFLGPLGGVRSTAAFTQVMVLGPARASGQIALPGRAPEPIDLPTNQSLSSQVLRRTDPGVWRWGLLGLLGLSLLPALHLGAREPRERAPSPAVAGLLLAWTLLAAPVAWHHHHLLLAPVLLGLAEVSRAASPGPIARLARGGLLAFLALSLLHFAVGPLRGLGLMGWGTLTAAAALATCRYTVSEAAGEKKS